METPLLQTKLYIPPPRPEFVPRPHLIERLIAGLHGKLTLVSAPAGFGKTTLVINWLLALRDWRADEPALSPITNLQSPKPAWLSLDHADDDPARFLDYFLAALSRADSGLEQPLQGIRQMAQQVSLENAIPDLINTLAAGQAKIILVLDDYHLIQNQSIHDALVFLLDHLPPQLHLVVTGRADPPFPLARLRARGQITEIRTDDLRFSAEEASLFLRQVMGIDLSPEDALALDRRTEGWIAGLQMAALSLQKRSNVSAFIRDFTGSHRYIMDYLTDEVLSRRPSGTQAFLLKTSILERLSAPLADSVTGQANSQEMLEQLEAANFFLVPLDDERRWYRYHHLFAGLLRHQLRQLYPDLEAELHRRAGQWFEAEGFVIEAIDHTLSALEFEDAARLIEAVASEMADRVEVVTLGRWVETLPQNLVLNRPRIVHAYVRVLSMSSRFDELGRYLQAAEQAALANSDNRAAQEILGDVVVLSCTTTFLLGNFPRARDLARKAQDILAPFKPRQERWSLISIEGYTDLVWLDNAAGAETRLLKAIALATAEKSALGGMLCRAFTANYHLLRGQLRRALVRANEALKAATRPDGTHLPSASYPQALLGWLYYEWNQFETALNYLLPAVNSLRNLTGFTADPLNTTLAIVLLKQAQGDPEAAAMYLWQAEQHFQNLPISGPFRLRLTAIRARLCLLQGDITTARQWADGLELPAANEPIRPINVFAYLTWVRVHLACNDFEQVKPVLERLYNWAQAGSLNGLVIETAMLQALSAYAQDTLDLAFSYLQTALTLAASEGYIRMFVDEGGPIIRLLRQAARKGIALDYVRLLLTVFDGEDTGKTLPFAAPRSALSALVEPLTDREIELLHLLAQGLTNQEIAARLVIAVSTVKRHAVNIYGKMGVRNRTEAVAKARELGLLET